MVKHISFDLWLTLIKSNKEFKGARLKYIKEYLDGEFAEDEIVAAFSRLSSLGDSYGEFFEQGFTSHQLYYLFFHQLYGKYTNLKISAKKLNHFVQNIGEIFVEYSPTLISPDVFGLMEHLSKKNITTNIASNTSFANGEMLRGCLKKLNILDYFKFTLFSDELGVFKPNKVFFKYIIIDSKQKPNEILHVGDNPLTDVDGALNAGIKPLLFLPETPNYHQILNYI